MTYSEDIREKKRKYWKEVWYPNNKAKHIANNTSYNIERRANVKKLLGDMKLEKGCIDCGYNSHPEALEYDHISDNKEFSVSRAIAMGYSMKRIETEISKCELVCANCHRVRTFNRRMTILSSKAAGD